MEYGSCLFGDKNVNVVFDSNSFMIPIHYSLECKLSRENLLFIVIIILKKTYIW